MSEQTTPSLAERRAAIQAGLLEQTKLTTKPAATKAERAEEEKKTAAEPKAKPTTAAPKPGQAKEE